VKALVYLGPGRMEVQELPSPSPGTGEIVIRSTASAICGSDLHGFREASPRRIPPLVMGHETVGVVAAVGDGVPVSREGERVVLKPILGCGECRWCAAGDVNHCARGRLVGRDLSGGFAAEFAVPASAAVALADPLPDDLAVLTEPLANAVHVADRAVEPDATVLVIGAGPIGVLMARAALLRGATLVFVTDPARDRLRFAEAQGAESLPEGDPAQAVADATGGDGVDVVIDAAGFEASWALGVKAVRPGGRIVEVGLGAPSGSLDYVAVLGKEATITGSYAWSETDFARSLDLLSRGALDPSGWITTMALDEGQRAFERLTTPGSDLFKVILTP
jgi:2-desacetyl-2-hydroxyethyl bacteriochlorophyllide A dehydrogenase